MRSTSPESTRTGVPLSLELETLEDCEEEILDELLEEETTELLDMDELLEIKELLEPGRLLELNELEEMLELEEAGLLLLELALLVVDWLLLLVELSFEPPLEPPHPLNSVAAMNKQNSFA